MKKHLILLSLVLLASCGNKQSTSAADVVLTGEYQLETLQGRDLSTEAFTFRFDPEAKQASGETGCNGFSSQYSQEGSEVVFTAPISTRKFCEGKMETENSILQAIENVAKIDKTGEELVFYSTEDEALFSLTKKDN